VHNKRDKEHKSNKIIPMIVFGALLFVPAAYSINYVYFLGALFVLGTGLTILQTASNPFVIYLGPKESAAKRIAIMGLINKVAGVAVRIVFQRSFYQMLTMRLNLRSLLFQKRKFKSFLNGSLCHISAWQRFFYY
jgi:fucose permease